MAQKSFEEYYTQAEGGSPYMKDGSGFYQQWGHYGQKMREYYKYYDIFSEEDCKYLIKYWSDVEWLAKKMLEYPSTWRWSQDAAIKRFDDKEAEFDGTNTYGVKGLGIVLRTFINKMLVPANRSEGDIRKWWTDKQIKVVELMLKPLGSVKISDSKSIQVNILYFFRKGGKKTGGSIKAKPINTPWRTGHYNAQYTKHMSAHMKEQGKRLTDIANKIVATYYAYRDPGDVDAAINEYLASNGRNKVKFREDVINEANKIVKGLVTVGGKVFRVDAHSLTSYHVKEPYALKLKHWVGPLKNGTWPSGKGLTPQTDIDIVTIAKTLRMLPKIVGGYGSIGLSATFNSYVGVRGYKIGESPKGVGDCFQETNWFNYKKKFMRINDSENFKDLIKQAENFTQTELETSTANGHKWPIQAKGLTAKALDELGNSYVAIAKGPISGYGWLYGNTVLEQFYARRYGCSDALAPVDNVWFRLLDILAADAVTLEKQRAYGLRNEVLKTVEDLYNEAVGIAGYFIAYQFLSWSHFAEVLALVRAIADLDTPIYEEAKTIDPNEIIKDAKKQDEKDLEDGSGQSAINEEEGLTEDEIEARQVFLKQCAMMMNMDRFKEACQAELVNGSNNYNGPNDKPLIHTLDVEDGHSRSSIMTRLTAVTREIWRFLALTPDIQSKLVPKIRLFKVYNNKDDNNKLKEIEFIFPKSQDPNDKKYRLSGGHTPYRGAACGIKNFDFSFEGTTPATARNDIVAELTLFFQDFNELLKERSSDDLFNDTGQQDKFRYIDLLMMPGSRGFGRGSNSDNGGDNSDSTHEHILSFDPSNHRIKVDVGWAIPWRHPGYSGYTDEINKSDILFEDDLMRRHQGSRWWDKDWYSVEGEKSDIGDFFRLGEVLERMNKSYYLNMVDHEMNFQEDGSVELKISYRAYFESATKSPAIDALSTPQLAAERAAINEEYKLIRKKGICKENKKRFEELMATYNAIEVEYVKRSHQSIVERLLKENKMHYCFINQDDYDTFVEKGFFATAPDIMFPKEAKPIEAGDGTITVEKQVENPDANQKDQTTKDVFLDSSLENFVNMPTGPKDSHKLITFFYIGDLVHILLDCLKDPNNPYQILPHMENFKILLSSFDYVDYAGDTKNVNISEIPISTEYFFEWMNQYVIKPQRKTYPLTYFIRDICNKLIVELMMEVCINKEAVKTLSFKTTHLNDSRGDGDFFGVVGRNENTKIKGTNHWNISNYLLNSKYLPFRNSEVKIDKMENFLLLYATTDEKLHYGTGNASEDEDIGIYHFGLAENKGIVKKVSFAKTDIQYIREARYMNHGHDGLMALGAVYKATIEMFGNTLFYPGMQLFIDPAALGGKDFDPRTIGSYANSLGIGGYHLITRVNNSIGVGGFNTTVEAQFVYAGDGTKKKPDKKDSKKPIDIEQTNQQGTAVNDDCGRITALRQIDLENIGQNEPIVYAELGTNELEKKLNEKQKENK